MLTNGAKVLTATHALSSAERAIRKKFGTVEPLELIANTLRLMGQGTKVCVEITLMAADAGLIPADEDVVAVAGTGGGADTALRIKPANAARLFDLRIREVLANRLTSRKTGCYQAEKQSLNPYTHSEKLRLGKDAIFTFTKRLQVLV